MYGILNILDSKHAVHFQENIWGVCMCVCGCACVSAVACRIQKRAPDSLELDLQAVAGSLIWALGTELGSSVRLASALNPRAIFPVPDRWNFKQRRDVVRLNSFKCVF